MVAIAAPSDYVDTSIMLHNSIVFWVTFEICYLHVSAFSWEGDYEVSSSLTHVRDTYIIFSCLCE